MNLTFLNPLFLFGLAASILPILIHRLTQRKAISRRFSAVRILIRSQTIKARPQRLKHFLLLALRILAIVSLVFMMARPVWTRHGHGALGNAGARAIVIDNSLSMGFHEERGIRCDLAKKAAKEALKGFEGLVAVIPTVDIQSTKRVDAIRWMKPEEALTELANIPLSFGQGNPTSALSMAHQKLRNLKMDKEILFIGDMVRGDWESFNLSQLGTVSDATITFLRIGGQKRDSNLTIKSVRLAEANAVVSVPARLEVTVSNLSDESGKTSVHLYLSDTKVDQKSLDLKAGEDGKIYFELFLDRSGWMDGEVRLSPDRLASDDIFYFSLKVREKVRVLIVDGDPKTSLRASESYYLTNALRPGGSDHSPFLPTVITESEMAFVDLKPYDALFLLNVAQLQPSRLASFMDLGRPVFIFLGDRVVPEDHNAYSFFPWRLGELKEVGMRPESISGIDQSHEVLRSISANGKSLKTASFRRYFRIDGSTRNLLTLGNRDPILVEAESGKSKLYLFTSSADLDWNDLPLKASYLPLIQGLLKESLGLTKDSLAASIRLGEFSEEENRFVQVKGTRKGPGIYLSLPPSGEVRKGVNPPLEESDLGKVSEDELKKKFGKMDVKLLEYEQGNVGNLLMRRKELWPYILIFLMVVLAVEMVLANSVLWKKS